MRRERLLDHEFDALLHDGALKDAAPRDRSLCYAIAATALRRHGDISAALGSYLSRPLPKSSGPVKDILIIATAQIHYMRIPARAAVDLAVADAKGDMQARHFSGLVNAVCRKLAADATKPRSDPPAANTPAWLFDSWRAGYGDEVAAAIAESHRRQPPLDLTVPRETEAWAARLGGEVFHGTTVRLPEGPDTVANLPGYGDGAWWVQDAASALPARLLGPVEGRKVLDLCAAPGGKTLQLAAAGADVTALDRSPVRLRLLSDNLARLRLAATVVEADLFAYAPGEAFDAVLLDAPCSATGTIRRHPDLVFHLKPKDVVELAGLQSRMIARAASFLKPGGILVFGTCSLQTEEGEAHARSLPTSLRLAPIVAERDGLRPEWIDRSGVLRTRPDQGLDGFFAMRLERV